MNTTHRILNADDQGGVSQRMWPASIRRTDGSRRSVRAKEIANAMPRTNQGDPAAGPTDLRPGGLPSQAGGFRVAGISSSRPRIGGLRTGVSKTRPHMHQPSPKYNNHR